MNTEQLKTAEEMLISKVGKLALSGLKWKSLNDRKQLIIEAMQDFANQEIKRAVEKDRDLRWISVKERLPEIEDADMKGNVLGWDKIQKETHKCNFQDIGQMKMRFTHWQSLPEPPIQLTP